MRLRILKNIYCFNVIKKITDTNILDGISRDSITDTRKTDLSKELEVENSTSFKFANMTMIDEDVSNNLLHMSIIYDSGAAKHLTHDRDRFVGEIASPKSEE